MQYAERNSGTLSVNQNHNETLSYDDNGNILGLTRRGLLSGTSTFGLIDNLSYTYTNSRLSSIAESASTAKGFKTGGAYTYDANGNMSGDAGKGMTVGYNFLNLPQYIAFNSGSEITLTYTAAGQKLTKVSGSTTKYYANGIEYNNTALEAVYFAEGRVVPGSPWKYQYALKDHLGNGRVWFEPNSANTAPVVTQQSHYYAFGMEMEALSTASAPNKYRYNGKELNEDFGLNWSDYGARWYDASVGRWWSVDPKPKTHESLYASFANSPIVVTDPDGQDSIIIHLQRIQGDKNAQKAKIILFDVTFYNVQNGNWKKIESRTSKLTGSNEFNLVMPGSAYRGLNKMEKKDFYPIKYQKMKTHENFNNTIMIQSEAGRGQYIHEGKDVNESAGCLLPCQKSSLEYTHHPGTEMSNPYSDVAIYKKPNGKVSGDLSRELLAMMREIYEEGVSNNSIPNKNFGFLSTTKDITPFINSKIAPESSLIPTPTKQNTIKNDD